MNLKNSILVVGASVLALAIAAPASAGSSSGTIGVSLNISAACAVNGGSATANMGQVGSITFPAQSGVFGNVDAALVPSAGSGGISVLCTPGLQPAMTIGAGAHDSGGVRHMASGSDTVAYRLYSDSGRTSEIIVGQQISLGTATTSAIDLPIYGRVSGGGVALAAGSYTDTVQVTLSW